MVVIKLLALYRRHAEMLLVPLGFVARVPDEVLQIEVDLARRKDELSVEDLKNFRCL